MKRKKFSASYPAASQVEYSRQANRCRLLSPKSERYGELGCKREEHIMVEGGRTRLRYPDSGPYKAESAKTRRRLANELPLWDERTQSPKSGRKSTLESRIASAIEQYRRVYPRENQVGFAVPFSINSLVQKSVGMPRSAASILVRRAAGRFYPVGGLSFPEPNLLTRFEGKAEEMLGSRVLFRFAGRTLQLVRGRQVAKTVEAIEVERRDGTFQDINDAKIATLGGDPPNVQSLFGTLSALLDRGKGKIKSISFFFYGDNTPLELTFSSREHSKSLRDGASRRYPEYKTLNVSLSELPELLARLARKGPKKGPKELKEISLSKENPMPSDDWYYKKQYSKSPYGSRRSLPAARRNTSIGSQMAADAMALHQETGMSLKAAWKQVKGHARANGYKKAKKNGGWYFGRGHGGGPKGSNLYLPDTTQTGPALVPHAPWDDGTEVFSALVPGPYAKKNSSKRRKSKSRRNRKSSALQNGRVHVAKNGQPYVKLANGQCRFISKAQAARMNGGSDYWRPYHPEYSEVKGQFSTGLRRTSGTQPYARRNKKRRKSRKR